MIEKPGITISSHLLTAVVLVLFSSTASSQARLDELGRLFTDDTQRDKLDAIRQGAYDEESAQQSTVSAVTVNGIVIRSDGENVVWVNGESTLESRSAKGISVYPGSADSRTYNVPLSVEGKRVRIKPGQSWTESSDQILDSY